MASDSGIPESATVWQLLALTDDAIEQVDLVAANLLVARGIPSLSHLDINRYCRIVDGWTEQFAVELPQLEAMFHQSPERWKNDIRFFRFGMLAGFLGHEVGIRYIEEQRNATSVRYTNPSDLFLNGVIDTKRGTCGNMAALHVAMCRRLGWPVALAAVKSHFISRFDDGEVVHNIEMSSVRQGTFSSDPDNFYIEKFGLPPRAINSGSDLRKLSMREMIGVFLSLRGRHRTDTGKLLEADQDYALARALFPTHRRTYIAALPPMLRRGGTLFDSDEVGHPNSLYGELAAEWSMPTVRQYDHTPEFGIRTATQAIPNIHMHTLTLQRS